jgi:predicted component of type VI protein secretion system
MIEFKIVATADKSQQSTYQHMGSVMTFGNGEGDMVIDDPSLSPLQAKISWQNGGYILENLAPEVEIRLNGKPVQDPVSLKEKDNLNVGRTVINFSRLDTQPLAPPPQFEHPNFNARVVEGSKEKAILDVLALQEKSATPAQPPMPKVSPPPLPGGMPPPPPKPPLPPARKS